jgi:predicted GNAT family acetyltransferase
MAFQTGETPRAGRVGMVYVPDDRRGGGFGRAVTAALSERILASGKAICCLLADSANPVSNRAYEAVGYRRVARFDEWLLSSGRP